MNLPVWTVLPLFQSSPREVMAMVTASEELGMTGVLATDHLAGWRRPTGAVLEASTVLGMVAGVAKRRVGSLVLQTSIRSPSYTAQVAQTLFAICESTPLFGLGVGDARWEREAHRFGLPTPSLAERIARLRLTITAIRCQAPDIELWVGGWKPELRELAAEMADGWNAWGRSIAEFEKAAAQVKQMNPAVQVSWGGLISTSQPRKELRQGLLNRVEAGAQSLVLAFSPPGAETLRRFAPRLLNHPLIQRTCGDY